MATLDERFDAAATKAEEASEIGREWANGDNTTEIQTASGPLPSLAKFLADNQTQIGVNDTRLSNIEGQNLDVRLTDEEIKVARSEAEKKLRNNAVVRLKFDTDEGYQHNDLSVTRGNATSLINYTCSTTATGQTAEGRIVEVAANTPRIVWNNGKAVGLLNEPSSENLLLWSEDFTQSEWEKRGDGSVSGTAILSPLGDGHTYDSYSSGGGFANDLQQIVSISGVVGDKYSGTWIFRQQNSANIIFGLTPIGNGFSATARINLATGVVDNISSLAENITVKQLYDGAYEVTMTIELTDTDQATMWVRAYPENQGNFYIASAQLEPGYPTSYIPTTTASAVRGETLTHVPMINKLNPRRGTLYWKGIPKDGVDVRSAIGLVNNNTSTLSAVTTLFRQPNQTFQVLVSSSDGTQQTIGDYIDGEVNAVALTYDFDEMRIYASINGSVATEVIVAAEPDNFTPENVSLAFGRYRRLEDTQANQITQEGVYSSMKLTPTELAALTMLDSEDISMDSAVNPVLAYADRKNRESVALIDSLHPDELGSLNLNFGSESYVVEEA